MQFPIGDIPSHCLVAQGMMQDQSPAREAVQAPRSILLLRRATARVPPDDEIEFDFRRLCEHRGERRGLSFGLPRLVAVRLDERRHYFARPANVDKLRNGLLPESAFRQIG